MKYRILIWLFIIAALTSCKKDNLFDCFKGAGKTVKIERDVSFFSAIHLHDNVDLILIQDNENKVFVETGENLQDGITTSVQANMLEIKNENKCNWVRSYENPMNVYVHISRLDSIYYRSSGNINCSNTINNDSIKMVVFQGSGSINLSLDCFKTYFQIRYGTADINLSGYSQVNTIISSGYGPVNSQNLKTVFTYISNQSTNNCHVYSTYFLEAKIENVGNIYYKGNPQSIDLTDNGEGQLIKLD